MHWGHSLQRSHRLRVTREASLLHGRGPRGVPARDQPPLHAELSPLGCPGLCPLVVALGTLRFLKAKVPTSSLQWALKAFQLETASKQLAEGDIWH